MMAALRRTSSTSDKELPEDGRSDATTLPSCTVLIQIPGTPWASSENRGAVGDDDDEPSISVVSYRTDPGFPSSDMTR
jgi:hypothetical protein